MKKKYLISAIIILVFISIIGVIIVLYNTPDIRIGMSHSADNQVNYPLISYRSTLGIGMSNSAQEKCNKVCAEFNDTVGKDRDFILTNYSDLKLDTDISYDGDKTIIHLYGSGIPKDGDMTESIDYSYTINYKLKPENQ